MTSKTKTYLYVGSGSWGGTNGAIDVFALNEQTLEPSFIDRVGAGGLASFLAFDLARHELYAADESLGAVLGFSVDAATGRLTSRDRVKASGEPVYVELDADGGFVLTAHYTQGAVEVFPRRAGGKLGAAVERRATGDQAHCIRIAPSGRHVFVPNKGSDTISQLVFDPATGKLVPNEAASEVAVSGGPRHLIFHPREPLAFASLELGNAVVAFALASDGTLTPVDRKPSLPPGFAGKSTMSDLRLAPSGKFLYGANRQGDEQGTLVAMAVDPGSGALSVLGHTSTRGRTPRHFALLPEGNALFVANRESNNLVSFRVDPNTGALAYAGTTALDVSPFFVGVVRWGAP